MKSADSYLYKHMTKWRSVLFKVTAEQCKLCESCLEETVNISHLHNDSLQLGVVLDCDLAILPAEA